MLFLSKAISVPLFSVHLISLVSSFEHNTRRELHPLRSPSFAAGSIGVPGESARCLQGLCSFFMLSLSFRQFLAVWPVMSCGLCRHGIVWVVNPVNGPCILQKLTLYRPFDLICAGGLKELSPRTVEIGGWSLRCAHTAGWTVSVWTGGKVAFDMHDHACIYHIHPHTIQQPTEDKLLASCC